MQHFLILPTANAPPALPNKGPKSALPGATNFSSLLEEPGGEGHFLESLVSLVGPSLSLMFQNTAGTKKPVEDELEQSEAAASELVCQQVGLPCVLPLVVPLVGPEPGLAATDAGSRLPLDQPPQHAADGGLGQSEASTGSLTPNDLRSPSETGDLVHPVAPRIGETVSPLTRLIQGSDPTSEMPAGQQPAENPAMIKDAQVASGGSEKSIAAPEMKAGVKLPQGEANSPPAPKVGIEQAQSVGADPIEPARLAEARSSNPKTDWAAVGESSRSPVEETGEAKALAAATVPIEPARLAEARKLDLVGQVSRSVENLVKNRPTSLRIRLHPEELGTIELHLTSGDEGLQVNIKAELPSTGLLLERYLGDLRQSLVESGVNLNDLNIGQRSQHGHPGDAHARRQPGGDTARGSAPASENSGQVPQPESVQTLSNDSNSNVNYLV